MGVTVLRSAAVRTEQIVNTSRANVPVAQASLVAAVSKVSAVLYSSVTECHNYVVVLGESV